MPPGKKTQVTDPLESSKIAAPNATPPPAPEAPAAAAAPPADAAPAVIVPPAPPVKLKRYKIVNATTVSLGGQLQKFHAGDIISADLHGPQNVQAILNANVAVVELDD